MLWKTKESQKLWSHPENKGEEEPVFQRNGGIWEGLCLSITVSLEKSVSSKSCWQSLSVRAFQGEEKVLFPLAGVVNSLLFFENVRTSLTFVSVRDSQELQGTRALPFVLQTPFSMRFPCFTFTSPFCFSYLICKIGYYNQHLPHRIAMGINLIFKAIKTVLGTQ